MTYFNLVPHYFFICHDHITKTPDVRIGYDVSMYRKKQCQSFNCVRWHPISLASILSPAFQFTWLQPFGCKNGDFEEIEWGSWATASSFARWSCKSCQNVGRLLVLSLIGNLTIDRYLTKLQRDVANVTPLADCVGSPPLCACIHPGMPSNEGLVRVSILQNLLQDIKIYGGESP